jgi:ABC-type glycerol-3-phosphate transport system substrate-binding protein
VRALTWEASYYRKDGVSNIMRFVASFGQYLTAQDGFESGKVAMTFDGEWNIAYAHENVPSMQVGAAPFPPGPGEEFWIEAGQKHRLSSTVLAVHMLKVAFGDWQQEDITRYADEYQRPAQGD